MPEEVSPELREFIAEQVGSIAQLELLLLLAADPARRWTAEEAATALYIAPDAAYGFLEGMRIRGLLETVSQPDDFRFAPQNREWSALVSKLALLYKERRLTVINLIFSHPVDKLHSFADAFRFRRPS